MKAHPHAELMKLYAEDAAETRSPWLRWQHKSHVGGWVQCVENPNWGVNLEYRRKPTTSRELFEEWAKTHTISWDQRQVAWEAWREAERQAKEAGDV
jgi:ATP sulfurylase